MTSTGSENIPAPKQVVLISEKILATQLDASTREAWDASAGTLINQVSAEPFLRRYASDSVELVKLYGSPALLKLTGTAEFVRLHAGIEAAKSVVSSLSVALTRFPDDEALSTWLTAIHRLTEVAPHQVSVVCNKSQVLLVKLDAFGFHNWVATGITSTGGDAKRLERYFSLEDEASRHVIELEASSVRLEDMERSLSTLTIGLWRQHTIIRPAGFTDPQNTPKRTSFDGGFIRVPISFDGFNGHRVEQLFKATITHVGAHLEHTGERRMPKALKQIQIAIVSILEDTRAELLAAQRYPGLLELWKSFHVAEAPGVFKTEKLTSEDKNPACYVVADTASTTENLLARLARALIDPDYIDNNPWIEKGRELFFAAGPNWEDPEDIRRVGVLLGNDIGQMRLQFNSKTYLVQPPYRDDNMGLWDFGNPLEDTADDLDVVTTSVRNEQTEEVTDDYVRQQQKEDVPESDIIGKIKELDDDVGIPICKLAEWDYLAASRRANWVTIMEHKPPTAPAHIISGILKKHDDVAQRISRLIHQSKVGQTQRLKRQREGDRLDLDACIQQRIDALAGQIGNEGIYETSAFSRRDLSVLVLLDISESTKDLINGTSTSVFHLERSATALLAEAMDGIGDPFAIHAFCSNGRQDLRYFRIKDFDAPYNDFSKSKLAGMKPGLSTRMGGALRFAGSFIKTRITKRKLVLVITDGEPSDIDIKDPKYLVEDSRKAVLELASEGIDVFAVGLDGAGHTYLPRIFGQQNMVQIDNVESLPERLPMLYFRLVA